MPQATFATFNIRHGLGRDERVDLDRTAETIRRTQADVLALQELDRFHPRSGGVDQAAELERLTGLQVSFTATVAQEGSEYGIALAHKGALEAIVEVELPRVELEEPRRAIVAEWNGLTVIATHLAVQRDANLVQQDAVAAVVAEAPRPAVLLGDLNASRRRLLPTLTDLLTPVRFRGRTVEPWWRFRQIDHVLVGPGVGVDRARVVPSRASDHRPVAVSLQWRVEDVAGVTYDV